MSFRRYTPEQREAALQLAAEIGTIAASKKLGIPDGTISYWRNIEKNTAANSAPTPAASAGTTKNAEAARVEVNAGPEKTSDNARVAKFYSPSLKAKVLEYAAQHGVTAAARKFGTSRYSIYGWRRRVTQHANGESSNSPVVGSDENPAIERDRRILEEWSACAGLGPSQVRNQLRRKGVKVSLHTVRCVMEQNGYVTPKVRRKETHDQRFEAVRPNQMWHLDFLHRHINKQKIYVLVLLDDHSRFIVGGAIWDGERVAAVQETFEAAVSRHGRPEKVLSDGGSAFYSWRGLGAFTKLLEELEVDQIVAKNPQTNGKLEVLNANIQKELFDKEKFFDLGETQRRFQAWLNFYNFRRTHQALGGILVPADRYFGRAEEVQACIESGGSPDGLGEPAPLGERRLDLFRVCSHRGQVEIHLLGHRLRLPVSS